MGVRPQLPNWRSAVDTHLRACLEAGRLGLVTDMDGTISVIRLVPSEAHPTPRSRELLHALSLHLPLVAVVSGRAADDVRARVDLPELVYVGNHGLERWQDEQVVVDPSTNPYVADVAAVRDAVQPYLTPGAWIEDKRVTLSVHYRQADDREGFAREIAPRIRQQAEEHGLRTFDGRFIVEVRPPIDRHKGTIFADLIREYDLNAALFLGDDVTDADAMRVARQLRAEGLCYAIGVGVQSEAMPDVVAESADIFADDIADVEDLLDWLLKALSASSS